MEEAGAKAEEGAVEARLADAAAGGSRVAGKSPPSDLLRDWPDDDEESLTDAHGAAPSAGEDASVDPLRRLRKAAGAGPARAAATVSRPHGKEAVEARSATKRPAAGPARERAVVKKKRRLAPFVGPRREPPTVIG